MGTEKQHRCPHGYLPNERCLDCQHAEDFGPNGDATTPGFFKAAPSAEPAPAPMLSGETHANFMQAMDDIEAGQPATAPDEEKTQMDNQQEMPIACISGELVSKPCSEMTNVELADFIEQGAWRVGANGSDESAYREAAKRLRQQVELLS